MYELRISIIDVSAIFIVVGAKLWQKGNHLLTKGKKADAIIFKNNFNRTGSDGGMYYPVVRFLTDKEEWITQELSIGYSSAKSEGTKLEVLYDPGDPTNVEVSSTTQVNPNELRKLYMISPFLKRIISSSHLPRV